MTAKYIDEIQRITLDSQGRLCLNGVPLLYTGDVKLTQIPGTTASILNISLIVDVIKK